jgi:hypothetical protein
MVFPCFGSESSVILTTCLGWQEAKVGNRYGSVAMVDGGEPNESHGTEALLVTKRWQAIHAVLAL